MAPSTFTVAICTRNRADMLKRCLAGLLRDLGDKDVPVLVIDNGSQDETCTVVEQCAARVQYFSEPKVGLSHARNRALGACETEYIVYLDDDGIPEAGWSDAIDVMIRTQKPDIFGGPYSPFYTTSKPEWFHDRFASMHFDLLDGPQPFGTAFSGGNMGWRIAVLKEFGGFDPALGMVGDALKLGEETALQFEIWNRKPDANFAFSRAMHMLHHVAQEKMTLRYIHRRSYTFGWQLAEIDPRNSCLKASNLRLVLQTKLGISLLLRVFVRDRKIYPFWKQYAASYLSDTSILLGVLGRRFIGRSPHGIKP